MSEYSEATESNENGDEMSTIRNFLTTEMRKRALDWLDVAQKVCRENQNVSDCTGCDWWTTCKGSIQTIRKALGKPTDLHDREASREPCDENDINDASMPSNALHTGRKLKGADNE